MTTVAKREDKLSRYLRGVDRLRWSSMAFTKSEARRTAGLAKSFGILGVKIRKTKGSPPYAVNGMATFGQVANFASEEARRVMALEHERRRGVVRPVAKRGAGGNDSGPSKRAKMGRKRQPQSAEMRRTLAGKFGARLSMLCEAANLDADEFGKKIGKSGDTVRLYFAGKVVPPLNDWPRLAKALGLPNVRFLLPE